MELLTLNSTNKLLYELYNILFCFDPPFKAQYDILNPLHSAEFSTDWLILSYLLAYLLIPSDKHNSIMAKDTQLISLLFAVTFFFFSTLQGHGFHLPQYNACNMVLPLSSFVACSFFHYVPYGFSVRLYVYIN